MKRFPLKFGPLIIAAAFASLLWGLARSSMDSASDRVYTQHYAAVGATQLQLAQGLTIVYDAKLTNEVVLKYSVRTNQNYAEHRDYLTLNNNIITQANFEDMIDDPVLYIPPHIKQLTVSDLSNNKHRYSLNVYGGGVALAELTIDTNIDASINEVNIGSLLITDRSDSTLRFDYLASNVKQLTVKKAVGRLSFNYNRGEFVSPFNEEKSALDPTYIAKADTMTQSSEDCLNPCYSIGQINLNLGPDVDINANADLMQKFSISTTAP